MIRQDNWLDLSKFGDLLKYQSRAKSVQESRAPTGRQGRNRVQDRISTAPGNEHNPTHFGSFIGCLYLQLAGDRRARRCYRSLCSDSYHEDRIAFVHLAPLQDYGEHAGITAMLSCEIPQQLGCSFGGVRVERDHLATRVAFNNCQF